MTTIAERLEKHVSTISPGMPFTISAQHVGAPESIPQGDLYIRTHPPGSPLPKGYTRGTLTGEDNRQLAIENGAGSHHRLQSLNGVEVYLPPNWGKEETDLLGPYIRVRKPNAIVHEPGHNHPHGTVHITVPCDIEIRYQRNFDAETRREIRARD